MNPKNVNCDPKEVALKSFFLGPQAENGPWIRDLVDGIFDHWCVWRKSRFPEDGSAISRIDQQLPEFSERRSQFAKEAWALAKRFEGEIPKFSPRYVGHMFSEVSTPAILGHMIALFQNPNLISSESAKVGAQVEEEAIRALGEMLKLPNGSTGHFTSGGTIANFEALIRGRERISLWLARALYAEKQISNFFDHAHMGWHGSADHGAAEIAEYSFAHVSPYEFQEKVSLKFGKAFKGPVVMVPENKHYSWKKGVSLLGLGQNAFWPIRLNEDGRLDVSSLREQIERARSEDRPIALIVSVLGTTELGEVDPIHEVQDLLDEYASKGLYFWHHVDAAYGGFFASVSMEDLNQYCNSHVTNAILALARVTSVTLDPHKLGYVPYSCGAFLVRERKDYFVKSFDAPYIQYDTFDRGPFTLEGSRGGGGAAAVYLTAKTIGLNEDGLGRILVRTIIIRKQIENAIRLANLPVSFIKGCDTNVLCFHFNKPGEKLSVSNDRTEKVFSHFHVLDQGQKFFFSKTTLNFDCYGLLLTDFVAGNQINRDSDHCTLIRLVIMNPFFGSKEMNTDFSAELVTELKKVLEKL